MFKIFIGIAFLGLIAIPVLILILGLRQNLIETIKPKVKKKPVRAKSYYEDSDELAPPKLRIVK